VPQLRSPDQDFVPLQLAAPAVRGSPSNAATEVPLDGSEVIRIEVSRAGTSLNDSWPLSASA